MYYTYNNLISLSQNNSLELILKSCINYTHIVEDENHFLFQCHFYHTLRDQFFQNVLYPEFDVMNYHLKLKYLMSETLVKDRSEYIYLLLLLL